MTGQISPDATAMPSSISSGQIAVDRVTPAPYPPPGAVQSITPEPVSAEDNAEVAAIIDAQDVPPMSCYR